MTPSQRHLLKFNPRRLFTGGVAGGFWDVSDRKTLFQNLAGTTPVAADGDVVGCIMDKSGNGNHLVASADDTTRPVYKTDGRYHWIEFDGTDDRLGVLFTISQPWERISAIRQISWTLGDRIFSSVTVSSGLLYQSPTTPTMQVHSGAASATLRPSLAVGADGVVTERHNGAASRVGLNNGAYTTGDAGSTATDGLRVGSAVNAVAGWSNIRWYGGIMRHGAMTESQIGNVKRLFANKAGVAL
jgi:hypothetical protein